MNFPSRQALGLHREVCQEIDHPDPVTTEAEEANEEMETFEEISIKEEMIGDQEEVEPHRKKARRPPPALIPIT